MLLGLKIENIAVIEKAEIEFSSGLNVLTGETGAGKSIIIKDRRRLPDNIQSDFAQRQEFLQS